MSYLINRIVKALPNRILSAVIDQIILVISFVIFSIGGELGSTPQEVNNIEVIIAIILFSIFLNKDIYFGQSIGKYFIGLRVVSSRTGNSASPIQCLVRNLFLLLWPLEALVLLFSHRRRIGDIVARTMVHESSEIDHQKKWQYIQAILSVLSSFSLVYYLFNFINSLGIMN